MLASSFTSLTTTRSIPASSQTKPAQRLSRSPIKWARCKGRTTTSRCSTSTYALWLMRSRRSRADARCLMAESEMLLRAVRLQVSYGRRTVLRDVNLEVRGGEFWFFLGPNGQGKTTLLRCILGTIKPQAGELQLSSDLEGRRRIGFVPQRCDLNPTLPTTVREFVLLGLVGIRCGRAEREERSARPLYKARFAGKA